MRVTWRTSIPARRARFLVFGGTASGLPAASALRDGCGHTRFAVTLRPAHGMRIRTVYVEEMDPALPYGAELQIRVH